ncbi:MAG: TIGR04084 family radical SAM/SPASM domain-containing protein [Methanolinea sp.]|nr:TIGR04084 family radical SAM/SPASM domain-containing protein [Methanolinea sp.]
MFYHLILTDDCNLCCRYCRGKMFGEFDGETPGENDIDSYPPPDLSIDLEILYRFLSEDPDPCLTFYGGEPLMRPDIIREIMDNAPVRRFMIQTNGTLLGSLGAEYTNRFETILVSIDGPEELTDLNRGKGTYRRIMDSLHTITSEGFSGEIIGRMTVTEDTDIFDAVRYLADNTDFSFQSIHWQLDACFSKDSDRPAFPDWLNACYNPGIHRLLRFWRDMMEEKGVVKRWYPFLSTTEDLLLGRPAQLRCGAGHSNYAIMTDGSIGPCPVMVGMKEYYAGHIGSSSPGGLREIPIGGACTTCDVRDFCGGRCLYSNITNPWPDDRRIPVCESVSNLLVGIQEILPDIRRLLESGKISEEGFMHTRYNGCEIIP